jgi:hypothetical protein
VLIESASPAQAEGHLILNIEHKGSSYLIALATKNSIDCAVARVANARRHRSHDLLLVERKRNPYQKGAHITGQTIHVDGGYVMHW